jgi:hypothetical protein
MANSTPVGKRESAAASGFNFLISTLWNVQRQIDRASSAVLERARRFAKLVQD